MYLNDIKVILYDLDNVLIPLQKEDFHFDALNESLGKFSDIKITKKEHKEIYNGLSTKQKLELLIKKKGLNPEFCNDIYNYKQELTIEKLKNFKPTIKFKELFRILNKKGFKQAICSNAVRSTIEVCIDILKIKDYIDLIVSNLDVEKRKPNPEAFIKAAKYFNFKNNECVCVEDSLKNIENCLLANFHTIEVKGPEEVHEKLIKFLNKYEKF